MNFLKFLFFLSIIGSLNAQTFSLDLNIEPKPYSKASAILLDGEMLVSEYSIYGKCKLEEGQKGLLSVSTITLTPGNRQPISPIEFQIAIKNEMSNTIRMFDNNIYTKIEIDEIYKKMLPGDSIIFMTTKKEYILMHNEVSVFFGC